MVTVTKEMRFECSHLLTGHEGRCANLHGHSYKVEITVTAKQIKDMVIDFTELKEAMTEIIDPFDHAFIFDENVRDFLKGTYASNAEGKLAKLVDELDMRWVAFPGRPTAENMAAYFAGRIQHVLIAQGSNVKVLCARVWETATSYAEYFTEV